MSTPYWHIWISNTKAAKVRLVEACIEMQVPMTSYLRHGDRDDRGGSISILVQIACSDRQRFETMAGLRSHLQWEWNPPCYFVNGSLIPHYASPEAQEEERWS